MRTKLSKINFIKMERGEEKYLGILPILLRYTIKTERGRHVNKNNTLFAALLHGEVLSHEKAVSKDFDFNILFKDRNFSGLRVIRIFDNNQEPNEYTDDFIECKHGFDISNCEASDLEYIDEWPGAVSFSNNRSYCDINHFGSYQ